MWYSEYLWCFQLKNNDMFWIKNRFLLYEQLWLSYRFVTIVWQKKSNDLKIILRLTFEIIVWLYFYLPL